MPSIFTKIINREIHQEIVYEDDTVIAILTIEPINPGHVLVVPKIEIDSLWDFDDATYDHLWRVARHMARHLSVVYPEYRRIATAVEGFGVPHAHIHIFGVYYGFDRTMTENAAHKHFADADELKAEADKIRAVPMPALEP